MSDDQSSVLLQRGRFTTQRSVARLVWLMVQLILCGRGNAVMFSVPSHQMHSDAEKGLIVGEGAEERGVKVELTDIGLQARRQRPGARGGRLPIHQQSHVASGKQRVVEGGVLWCQYQPRRPMQQPLDPVQPTLVIVFGVHAHPTVEMCSQRVRGA